MTALSRALAGALLVVSVLGSRSDGAVQTVRVVQALGEGTEPSPGYTKADSVGLTYDQWRTGRLVLGVLGLVFLGFFVFRALRARWSQRRTSDEG